MAALLVGGAVPGQAQSPLERCAKGDFVCRGAQNTLTSPARPEAPAAVTPPATTPGVDGSDGWVWLGNLNGDKTLAAATVKMSDGRALEKLDQLTPNTTVRVVNRVWLREGLPKNDAEYFRGQRTVGLLEIDQNVTLMEPPTAIPRSSGLVQLWGRVRRAS